MRSLFRLVSLLTSIVSVTQTSSSYLPVSFPLHWSCPIYDAKFGKMIHTIHKGDFCSNTPSFKGKVDAMVPTCHQKIFPVITFTFSDNIIYSPPNRFFNLFRKERKPRHPPRNNCSVVLANGLDDKQNRKCIQMVINSNKSKKMIDWLVYYVHGYKNPYLVNDTKVFQKSDWLEEDYLEERLHRREEWTGSYMSYIGELLILR